MTTTNGQTVLATEDLQYTFDREGMIQAFYLMKDLIRYQTAATAGDFETMMVYFAKFVRFEAWPFEGRADNPLDWKNMPTAMFFKINREVAPMFVDMFRESRATDR